MSFSHEALNLTNDKNLVYTAMSKHLFYYRMHISKYVIEQHGVPLNPFMIFDCFLLDSVNRDLVREGNNNLVKRADEIWVFGPVSNGVLAEIKIGASLKKLIRYFKIEKSNKITPISVQEVEMEDEVRSLNRNYPWINLGWRLEQRIIRLVDNNGSHSPMDRMQVSGTWDVGPIPTGST